MIDTIRNLLEKEPFQPFRIVTTSGDRYEVLNPHLLAIMESQLFYCFPRSDRFAFIRLNQVVSVETLSAAA